MAEIQYRFAKDKSGTRIDINDVTSDMQKNVEFFCISCEAPMCAVINTGHKQRFFRHKVVPLNCNKETYLHRLSKQILKDRFDHSDTFEIKLYRAHSCDLYSKCTNNSKNENDCCQEELDSFDLKKWYQECIPENRDVEWGMIPDLKLIDTNGTHNPIWLEVFVTHACTENKLNTGARIIEFKIETEEQAIALQKIDIKESTQITFHNFQRDSSQTIPMERNELEIERHVLLTTGYVQQQNISCRESYVLLPANAIASVEVSETHGPFSGFIARQKFASHGIGNFKHCSWCKYRKETYLGDKICICYKSLQIPKEPNLKQAYYCPKYNPIFPEVDRTLTIKDGLTLQEIQLLMKDKPQKPPKPQYQMEVSRDSQYQVIVQENLENEEIQEIQQPERLLYADSALFAFCRYNKNGLHEQSSEWDQLVVVIEKQWVEYNREVPENITQINSEAESRLSNSLKEHLKIQYTGRGIGNDTDFEKWYKEVYLSN